MCNVKPTYSRPWEIDIIHKMRGLGKLWIGTGNESLVLTFKDEGQGLILISLGFMSGIVTMSKD